MKHLRASCANGESVVQALQKELELTQSQLKNQIALNKQQAADAARLNQENSNTFRILQNKDAEITRLMNEIPQKDYHIKQLQSRCDSCEASLAALSAACRASTPDVEQAQPERVSGSDTRVFQALSSQVAMMSSRIDSVEQIANRPQSRQSLNVARPPPPPSQRSLSAPGLHVGGPPFGDPGDGDDGDWGEDGYDDEEEELVEGSAPTTERDIVDSRALHSARIDPIPSTAAEFRIWKNSLFLMLGSLDISGFDYLMTWLSHAFRVDTAEMCSSSSEKVPRLDRWLASQLIKGLKGVPDLQ